MFDSVRAKSDAFGRAGLRATNNTCEQREDLMSDHKRNALDAGSLATCGYHGDRTTTYGSPGWPASDNRTKSLDLHERTIITNSLLGPL